MGMDVSSVETADCSFPEAALTAGILIASMLDLYQNRHARCNGRGQVNFKPRLV